MHMNTEVVDSLSSSVAVTSAGVFEVEGTLSVAQVRASCCVEGTRSGARREGEEHSTSAFRLSCFRVSLSVSKRDLKFSFAKPSGVGGNRSVIVKNGACNEFSR